jgi:N-acyl-D-aspartate/D-glutamate deacylase
MRTRPVILLFLTTALYAQTYDTVIANGRVMDPESSLDAIRNIGIRGRSIAAISERPLQGRTVIDAKGLVVTPGFIDLHSHGQDDENYRYKARDGVTTALELEVGVSPVAPWYAAREGKALINFGATVGHIPARMKVMHDTGTFLPHDEAAHRIATSNEQRETEDLIRRGLDEKALGIGLGIAYVPSATHPEILNVIRIAADRKATVFVHMRSPGAIEPGSVTESLQEMIADAAITGASIHVVHITSMANGQTGLMLEMIAGARKRGLDITTEAYPYTAGETRLDSAIFDGNWQQQTRHHLQRSAMGRDRRTPHRRDLREVSKRRRLRDPSFDPRRSRAPGNGESRCNRRQRRHDFQRHRPSARSRHLCASAGPLRAR